MQGEHRKPSQMFHSVGLSLDASIPEKVKTKIFNNEYIDFGVLINNHLAGEDKYHPLSFSSPLINLSAL